MKLKKISLALSDKYVKIKKIIIKDNNIVSQLNNIGIFEDQIVLIKNVSNNKNMILISCNFVDYVFRIKDVENIFIQEVNKIEKAN